MDSSTSEQTNLQVSNNNVNNHALSPKSNMVSCENTNNNANSLLVPSVHDACFASKEAYGSHLGSGHQCTESLPFSTSSGAIQRRGNYKKNKRTSVALDHIMYERKRRQELTKKFIALSATIPGLKKMEKAYVLSEAIKYVKQLEEQVKELEEGIKKSNEDMGIVISKFHLYIEEGNAICEANNYSSSNGTLVPDVKASVLGNDILIKIHCGKQKGILPEILSQIHRLHHHISIVSSNVLPFGNTLDITIIAKMGDSCMMIVKDLMRNLRVALLKSCVMQHDAF